MHFLPAPDNWSFTKGYRWNSQPWCSRLQDLAYLPVYSSRLLSPLPTGLFTVPSIRREVQLPPLPPASSHASSHAAPSHCRHVVVLLLFSFLDLVHASELSPCVSHTACLSLMSVSVLGLPQCLAHSPQSVKCLDAFPMAEISKENSLSFFCRISDMKPVTSHVEWPSFLRTKTETGTEMSVPVSIHMPILVSLLPPRRLLPSCQASQSRPL